MKIRILMIPALLATFGDIASSQERRPRFKDYPVTSAYIGRNAPVDFRSNPNARTYRTRLREAASERPNFAGSYIVTAWGCGTSCLQVAIINSKTGKVFMLPFTVCCWSGEVENPLAFRLDSGLFIVNGMRNEQEPNAVFYYKMESGKLRLIHTAVK